MGLKISQMIQALVAQDSDVLAGVQNDANKKFPLSLLYQYVKGKLTPTLNGKQDTITASGILKGDGAGGVSAATAGTDYQAPLTAGTDYATPAQLADKANQTQLAYVETGATASRNYSAGQYICWNGLLYTADIDIVSGATLSASGGSKNLTETTIGNSLYTSIGYASSSASISSVTGTIVRVGVNYIFNLQIVVGTAIARFIPLVEFSAPASVRTTVTNPAVWIVNHQAAGTQYAGFVSYASSKHVISSSTQLPVGTYSVYAVVTMM